MEYLITFAVSFLCGILCTFIVRGFALKFGIVNHPNKIIATHVKPVAYLGGAGIFAAIIVAVLITDKFVSKPIFVPSQFPLWATVSGAIGFLLFGILDDLITFRPIVKLICQSLLAIVSVSLGISIHLTQIPVLDFILSVGYIIVIVNATNVTDVCDGLVGGLCAITFLIVSIFIPSLSIPALIVSASTFGFLVFNFPPASIYLGDAGAHFLGFLLAVLGMQGFMLPGGAVQSLVWLALIPGVVLFEMTFLIVVRSRKGLAWWRGSPDHFSLRLQAAGFSRRVTDFMAWTANVILVIVACSIRYFTGGIQILILVVLLSGIILTWRFLLRHEVKKR